MAPKLCVGKNSPYLAVRYGENLRITVAANQGGRKYMEDRVHIETVREEDGSIKFTFFGIFDGHGGCEASEYVRKNLLNNIMKNELFESDDDDEILEAIRLGFLTTHHGIWKIVSEWPRTASGYPSTAGTTVSVAIIKNGKLYSGHVGDSAIILLKRTYRKDNTEDLLPHRLTVDHKPESEDEQARIRLAGGSVALKSGVARVVWTRPLKNHSGPVRRSTPTESIPFLAVARSLGDVWSYCEDTKEFVVSPEPDLAVHELAGDDVCLVLASDGLTNVLGPVQVAAVVDEEESVSQIGADRYEDLVYRAKHTNLARILVANAFRNWRHLRADNVTAIVVMLDSPYAELPLDHPSVEECLDITESVDKVFVDDPECMVYISPTSSLKLFTYRTPIIYKGARDPNFSVVEYTGPGFITHTEERLIEEHYRAAFADAQQKHESPTSIEINSIGGFEKVSTMNGPAAFPSLGDFECEHVKSNIPIDDTNVEGTVPAEFIADSVMVRSEVKLLSKRAVSDDDSTDDEEAGVSTSTAAKLLTKSHHPTEEGMALCERRVTRSAAKPIIESSTTPRPLAVGVRRSSMALSGRTTCRSACVDVEDKVIAPSGSVDIKIHVASSLSPSFGMITRSRDRSSTTLVVDVRTPPQRSTENRSPHCRTMRDISITPMNGSRKRSHRIFEANNSGITPMVHSLNLDTSSQSLNDNNTSIVRVPPKMRSAPSTPSKVDDGKGNRMGSKWSLSKLDTKSTLSDSAVTSLEVGEPPSKMRRIYGFMRRLVGFGLGNGGQ